MRGIAGANAAHGAFFVVRLDFDDVSFRPIVGQILMALAVANEISNLLIVNPDFKACHCGCPLALCQPGSCGLSVENWLTIEQIQFDGIADGDSVKLENLLFS